MFDGLWEAIKGYNNPQLVAAVLVVGMALFFTMIRQFIKPGAEWLASGREERKENRLDSRDVLNRQLEEEKKEHRECERNCKECWGKLSAAEKLVTEYEFLKQNPDAMILQANKLKQQPNRQ